MIAVTDDAALGVQSLVAPLEAASFMADYWGQQCWFVPRLHDPQRGLFRRLASCSVRELLRMTDSALVMHRTTRGEYQGTRVAAADAFAFYQANLPLYFDLSERIPEAAGWLDALASDLGQRRSRIRISIFLSPKGGTTECHFDSNENFTVQLRGHKRWRLAANLLVRDPIERFTASIPKLPKSSLYFTDAFDPHLRLPNVVDLVPGAMLYVPRGWWHQVEAIEPSTSVNFCIAPETWLSYLLPVIERRLVADAAWRAAAIGVLGSSAERAAARATAKRLLDALSATLSDMSGQEIVTGVEVGAADLVADLMDRVVLHRSRTALLSWSMDTLGDVDRLHIRVEAANTTTTWNAAPGLASVCAWIADQHRLTSDDCAARFPNVPTTQLRELLNRLAGAGLLYIRADSRAP